MAALTLTVRVRFSWWRTKACVAIVAAAVIAKHLGMHLADRRIEALAGWCGRFMADGCTIGGK